MTNNIDINDRNKEVVNDTKFKNIILFDYQIKTIEKLLEHEKSQFEFSFTRKNLKSIFNVLHYNLNDRNDRYLLDQQYYNLKKRNTLNIGCNIGVLSNKVGSGKTYIILGMIMSKNINGFKTLKTYYEDDIYTNSKFDKDTCSIIAEYLVEENDIELNTSKDKLDNNMNLFNTLKKNHKLNIKKINNLIIVPHNLYQQWKDEISNNTILDAYYIKSKRDLQNLQDLDKKDLVLCNVNKLKQLLEIIEDEYDINRLFIDEADTINLGNFPEINSKFLWLITTTYERLLTPKNQGFIKDLFNPIAHGMRNIMLSLLKKITYTFNPTYIDQKVDLKNPKKKYLVVQNNFINKLFYRLNKTNYYKFVNSYDYITLYDYISSNIQIHNNVYRLIYILENFFNPSYQNNISYPHNLKLDYQDESSLLYIYILKILCSIFLKNSVIQGNYRLYQSKKEDDLYHKTECRVCDSIKCTGSKKITKDIEHILFVIKNTYNYLIRKKNEINYIRSEIIKNGFCTNCLHIHLSTEDCITSHFKTVFDTYNANILEYDFIIEQLINNITHNFVELNNYKYTDKTIYEPVTNASLEKKNLKIKHLISRLRIEIKNKKRCLLFSDNNNFFKFIEKQLKDNNIKSRVLKGNSNTINSILKKYKNRNIDVLLMNMKYCGSGLNLQMSDNIYIMNMIDKNTETQVIGRVNRINKVGNFEINYFFTEDEYQLYNENKEATEMIIDDDNMEEIIIEEI